MKSLRFWILTLITFTMIGILTSALFSGYLVTKKSLIDNSLEQNLVYSKKLAQMSEELFDTMWVNLEARKPDVIAHLNKEDELTSILEQLLVSEKNFNSVSIIGKDGVAIATSPNVGITGKRIDSEGVKEALEKKKNIITKPYVATTGRLLILVSTPLFNDQKEYLGMLNGTIYLQEDNFIRTILAEHYSKDGSYVYVVDREGTLIYHPEAERIGENVAQNMLVKRLLNKESGSMTTDNTQGKRFLAGYTFIGPTQWGVVSQTPYSSSLEPLTGIILKMFFYSLPLAALFIFIAFSLSTKLAAPLQKLAYYTLETEGKRRDFTEKELGIPTWYFEARQLTEIIEKYMLKQEETVEDFKKQSLTDSLTGLKNRRYAEYLFNSLVTTSQGFSLIMLDIDFFKKVNDEFGHKAGDEVLQFLANTMQKIAGQDHTCIRLGGEEFAIVLPESTEENAYELAEVLRKEIEQAIPPTKKTITISNGVGAFTTFEEPVSEFMNRVDLALYKAKETGRNRTVKVSELDRSN